MPIYLHKLMFIIANIKNENIDKNCCIACIIIRTE